MPGIEDDLRPRSMQVAELAGLYVYQLASDLEEPMEAADFHAGLSARAAKLARLASTYDFVISHTDLYEGSAPGEVGRRFLAALGDDDIPVGLREIYRGAYGADLQQYREESRTET